MFGNDQLYNLQPNLTLLDPIVLQQQLQQSLLNNGAVFSMKDYGAGMDLKQKLDAVHGSTLPHHC